MRYKAQMVTTAIDPEKTVSDDHRGDPAKRGWQPEGFGPEGTSTGSRAQRFESSQQGHAVLVRSEVVRLKTHGVREEFTTWCKTRTGDLTVAVETGSEEKADLKGEFCPTRTYQRVSPDQDP